MDLLEFIQSPFWGPLIAELIAATLAIVSRIAQKHLDQKDARKDSTKSNMHFDINFAPDMNGTRPANTAIGNSNTINNYTDCKSYTNCNLTINVQDDIKSSPPPIDPSCDIAPRLRRSLELINENRLSNDTIDIYRIAKEIAKDDSITRVQEYFSGTQAPSFTFLESFSEAFGLNQEWITSGKGTPFLVENVTSPEKCEEIINDKEPDEIYFVLSNSDRRQACLIIRTGELSYLTIEGSEWPMAIHGQDGTPNVGAGGLSSILGVYDLICTVYESLTPRIAIQSLQLDCETFECLVSGDICPYAAIFKRDMRNVSHWADDLRDINGNNYGGQERYRKLYGDWFLETQSFIKARIQKATS